jgi:hypothetical protein
MTEPNNKPKARRTTNKRTLATLPAAVNKGRHLEISVKPGETQDRVVAGMLARGLVTNASTAIWFLRAEHADLSLMDMVRELREQGEAVNCGDLSGAERMLNAQAVALNAIFAEMARRAALNMGEHLPATETYMRLALKAQGQCRSTLETLAAMKNPPVVFARQANINNGGQQQVNNRAAPESETVCAGTHGHTENEAIPPNELLEDSRHGRTLLDTGAAQATGGKDSVVETVGAVNRAA